MCNVVARPNAETGETCCDVPLDVIAVDAWVCAVPHSMGDEARANHRHGGKRDAFEPFLDSLESGRRTLENTPAKSSTVNGAMYLMAGCISKSLSGKSAAKK